MKRKQYDDDLLVELIAEGELSPPEIARKAQISRSAVLAIAAGGQRPDLQGRIKEAEEAYRRQARRMGARKLRELLREHIRHGMDGDGEHARKCREFAINKIWGQAEQEAPGDGSSSLPAPGLTAEDYEAISAMKGGPTDDESSGQ